MSPRAAAHRTVTYTGLELIAAAGCPDPDRRGPACFGRFRCPATCKLTFPIGHSADADKIAAATGAYVNDEPHYLQSTGFVLAPDGTVRVAVYSSDAIGRLVADDMTGYIRDLTQHAA